VWKETLDHSRNNEITNIVPDIFGHEIETSPKVTEIICKIEEAG
jgi:hypothetical protein